MARRFENMQGYSTYLDHIAVAHGMVGKLGVSLLTKDDDRAGEVSQLTMAADKVCMKMGFEHMRDFEALGRSLLHVLLHIALGINHHGLVVGADEVGRVSKTAKIKLLKVRWCSSRGSAIRRAT
ncbi:MAG TPA: hypothetical protein VIJ38_14595 [Acidobacteriaceae bacterium]